MVVQLLQTCQHIKVNNKHGNVLEYLPINDGDGLPIRSVSVAQHPVIHAQIFEAFHHCKWSAWYYRFNCTGGSLVSRYRYWCIGLK